MDKFERPPCPRKESLFLRMLTGQVVGLASGVFGGGVIALILSGQYNLGIFFIGGLIGAFLGSLIGTACVVLGRKGE